MLGLPVGASLLWASKNVDTAGFSRVALQFQLSWQHRNFIQHYRPSLNVVKRPTLKGGKGYTLIGHHELMFPLLAAAVIEKLK